MTDRRYANSTEKINILIPNTVREYKFSLFFGLIYFWYLTEDRRPDLDETTDEGIEQIKDLGYKYKTQIKFKFFFIEKWMIIHSIRKGSTQDD